MSFPSSESPSSKNHLSSTLWTEKTPLRDWALAVITSLYGFGPVLGVGAETEGGTGPDLVVVSVGMVFLCWAISPGATKTVKSTNMILIRHKCNDDIN